MQLLQRARRLLCNVPEGNGGLVCQSAVACSRAVSSAVAPAMVARVTIAGSSCMVLAPKTCRQGIV